MGKKEKAPCLRFKDTNGKDYPAWEQRKLGELAATFGYGLNAAAKSFDGRHKYIRITDIDESTRRFLCSSLTSPDIDFEEAAPYRLAEGDVLFARTGASVGKSYRYVRTDGEVYFAGFLIRFRFKDKEAAEFVFQNSLTAKFQNFIKTSSQRSGQPGINAQQFSGYQIAVPNSEERERIGSFFSRLDTAITLHQRKLETLKKLKRTLLQKMFPKKGQLKPELRFPGFTNDWEQRKLKDIAEIVGGGTPSTSVPTYWNGSIDWYSPTEVGKDNFARGSKRKISKEGLKNSSAKLLPPHKTILFTSRATIGEAAILEREGATNQGFQSIVTKEGTDVYFLYSYKNHLKKQALIKASGSTFLEISKKAIEELQVQLPSFEEQTKIGSFFRFIDQAITLHQRKLETYKKLKKSLLQKMFI